MIHHMYSDLSDAGITSYRTAVSQARFRKIAKHIHELKQVMRDDAATAFFSLTQAAQYVAGDFRGKVRQEKVVTSYTHKY